MPPSSWSSMCEACSKLTIAACSFCMVSIYETLTIEAVCSTETSMNSYQTTRRYIPEMFIDTLWEAQVQCFLTLLIFVRSPQSLLSLFCLPFFVFLPSLCFFYHSTLLSVFSGPRPFLYFRFKKQSAHPFIVRRSQHLTGVSRSGDWGRPVTSKYICSQR